MRKGCVSVACLLGTSAHWGYLGVGLEQRMGLELGPSRAEGGEGELGMHSGGNHTLGCTYASTQQVGHSYTPF